MTTRKQKRCKYLLCKKTLPANSRPDKEFCDSYHRKLERNRKLVKSGLCRACAKPRDPNSKVFCAEHLRKSREYKAKSVKGSQ